MTRGIVAFGKEERRRSILFYSDASEFGGHEMMTLAAVENLSRHPAIEISFVFYEGNKRLRRRLEELRRSGVSLLLYPVEFKTRRLEAFRALLSPFRVRRITSLMKQISPEVVVVSQGRIESGSAGLRAAKRAGFHTVSYIPMAHPAWLSGRPLVGRIQEVVNAYFYRLPDKFITISETARRMLIERGTRAAIMVVPNYVEHISFCETDRQSFREKHGLEERQYVVAVVGRIDFRQKGQDFAVASIARFQKEFEDYKFLFIGDGPDVSRLKKMILSAGLGQRALVLPWERNRSEIYSGIDMLLIPSKYEGLPLVMLEAMQSGSRIVASNVDGMAECLPPDWLFPYGDVQALARALVRVRRQDASVQLEEHKALIAREYTLERFAKRLIDEVLS